MLLLRRPDNSARVVACRWIGRVVVLKGPVAADTWETRGTMQVHWRVRYYLNLDMIFLGYTTCTAVDDIIRWQQIEEQAYHF